MKMMQMIKNLELLLSLVTGHLSVCMFNLFNCISQVPA